MTTALLLRVDALLDERLLAIGADMSSPYNPVLEFLKMVPLHLIGYEVRGDGTVHVSRILTKSMNLVFRMDGDSILYTSDEIHWTGIEMSQILTLLGMGDGAMHSGDASALQNILTEFNRRPRNTSSRSKPAAKSDARRSVAKSPGSVSSIPRPKPMIPISPSPKPAAIPGSIKKKK